MTSKLPAKKTNRADEKQLAPLTLREKLHEIIFEADTPAGKAFDLILLLGIVLSVLAVVLESVASIREVHGVALRRIEWFFTILFTIEYVLRLWCIKDSWRYARSFYGVIDLIGIIPTYLSLFLVDAQYLLVVRILRVLRVFRVLRMVRYVDEGNQLRLALAASRRKITVFVVSVLLLVVVFGSLMYLIEGPEHGFTSIPKSIYWAVITLTTVGYGDLVPITPWGQGLASIIMIMGYGIIAVPTGIVTMELSEAKRRQANTRVCPNCSAEGHTRESTYCWRCGKHLFEDPTPSDKAEQTS